ncbi:MAG: putative ABC transporter permease [Oscillospiraceae bacterium]|nr:putative ABC transporter permease [Oscillospiraceae bacterium]
MKTLEETKADVVQKTSFFPSFASGLNVYKLIWIFTIGSVLGYLLETAWFFLQSGHYICRQGVVFGPISEIYGFGAVLLTLALYRIRNKNAIWIFLFSGILGASFEYFCSFFQEKLCGTISWDYSDQPFNLHGRTSLAFVVVWGVLGLIFIKHMYPFLSNLIEKIPNQIGKVLTIGIAIFMTLDLGISGLAIWRQTQRRADIPSTNFITHWLDAWFQDEFLDQIYTGVTVIGEEEVPDALPSGSPPQAA